MPDSLITVFYDGHCALCHGLVRFLLARDPLGTRFDFSPLQGHFFAATVPESERINLPDSIVIRSLDGQLLVRSAAVIYVLTRLGGFWRCFATVAGVLPQSLLDRCYDAARARRRIFGRPDDLCPRVPEELRARFHT